MKRGMILLLIIVMLMGCTVSKETLMQREEQRVMVQKALDDRRYRIEVHTAFPNRGGTVNVSSEFALEVKGDTVVSYLPFFGRAYNVPLGGGKGLNFTAPIKAYSDTTGKRGTRQIRLVADNQEDVITFRLEIESDGRTDIRVQQNKREGIGFSGSVCTLVRIKEKNILMKTGAPS